MTDRFHRALRSPKKDSARAIELLHENLDLYRAQKDEVSFRADLSFGEFLKLVDSLPEGEIRTAFLTELVQHSGSNVETATYWETLPREKRIELIEGGLEPHQFSPVRQLDGFEQLLREYVQENGGTHKAYQLVDAYAGDWVKEDFEGSLDWVSRHIKGSHRTSSLEKLWREAARLDLEETIKKWDQLPDNHMKKKLAESISYSASYDDRDELLERLIGK